MVWTGAFGSEMLETVTFMTIALRFETFPSAQSPARKNQVHQSWSFGGARASVHCWSYPRWTLGQTSVLPSFQLFPATVWDLCFTVDLNSPWSCSQKCRGGLVSVQAHSYVQGISPEHDCTHARSQVQNSGCTQQSWRCRDLVIVEVCFQLKHLQDQGPSSAGEIRIRFCVVLLEGLCPAPIAPTFGSYALTKGKCLSWNELMLLCCCSARVSSFVFADTWIIPWQMVGFTLLYARMCLR